MKKYEVLNQLKQNEISVDEAYKLIYDSEFKIRKAHFVKLKIKVKESKGVSALLAVVFLFPIPLVIVKMILRRALKNGHGI